MTQEFLDHAEVGAPVEQVGREGVAQGMRAHAARDAGRACRAPDDGVDGARGQPTAARVDEDRPAIYSAISANQCPTFAAAGQWIY